jgi:alpha-ribazole phosphatase
MLNLYLLRHGKTQGKAALNGHTDVAVDESIQANIADLLPKKYSFSKVYTSPLRRCSRVAELLTASNSALRLVIEPRIMELNFGMFDGIPFDELESEWQALENFWAAPDLHPLPSSEPLEHGYDRVIEAWEQIVQQCEQDTLVITHGGPIRYILAYVLGIDWKNPQLYTTLNIGNQSLTHIQISKYEQRIFATVKSVAVPLE